MSRVFDLVTDSVSLDQHSTNGTVGDVGSLELIFEITVCGAVRITSVDESHPVT